jgi:hypothetical protein
VESIRHTHTHSGRNFHSYGPTVPPCVCVRRASKQETGMCTLHRKTLSIPRHIASSVLLTEARERMRALHLLSWSHPGSGDGLS